MWARSDSVRTMGRGGATATPPSVDAATMLEVVDDDIDGGDGMEEEEESVDVLCSRSVASTPDPDAGSGTEPRPGDGTSSPAFENGLRFSQVSP